ncbi:hypothetical protein CAPTEDRAFT_172896 [Capitella teleta]|uniref:Probable RNA-binding protein EIF1AD n=1 Tax=Capitella teleta TaxID=283909 RepID=R7VL32_CAPTE|nr:hypothetical protein CAPTEDRAFT_172896 [Capitella teleta]|eukprot:ELU17921.1 hypothetical protein CAPTEDRAFT_172896 [Capitella teleta]
MSIATKRKYVTQEVMEDYILPEGDQVIVRVLGSKGNNLHEVETPLGEKYLASMPTRFRKNVWIKRGDYVMVIPIAEGDKVKAEIINILYKDQIKYINQEGLWPAEFSDVCKKANDGGMIPDDMMPPSESESEEDEDDSEAEFQTCNPNARPAVTFQEEDQT